MCISKWYFSSRDPSPCPSWYGNNLQSDALFKTGLFLIFWPMNPNVPLKMSDSSKSAKLKPKFQLPGAFRRWAFRSQANTSSTWRSCLSWHSASSILASSASSCITTASRSEHVWAPFTQGEQRLVEFQKKIHSAFQGKNSQPAFSRIFVGENHLLLASGFWVIASCGKPPIHPPLPADRNQPLTDSLWSDSYLSPPIAYTPCSDTDPLAPRALRRPAVVPQDHLRLRPLPEARGVPGRTVCSLRHSFVEHLCSVRANLPRNPFDLNLARKTRLMDFVPSIISPDAQSKPWW